MARTLDQLAIIANQIKDATLQGENTADRVGGLLVDLIDFLRTINVDEIALSPLLTALNESGLVDPQDGQILKFKSSEDNWVFSSDITQITSTIRTILDTLGQLDNRFVKKTGDIMTGLLTTLAGIKVRNFLQLGDRFVSGLLGEGAIFRENVGGRTYLEADEMYIRVKAYFDTVEIRKFLHSGGNRIASLGGAKCVRVEMLDSNNEVVTEAPAKYRCYFRASDGDDTITNDFVVGDQAYCHVTNATNSSLSMRHYWRLVIGKNELPNENGEHWIDLSNQESETIDGIVYSGYLNISDAPAAQDDIIQLGNVNDSTRRGAIIEFVSGNDAPAYQIFQDLGSIGSATTIAQKHDAQYSYNGKNYISMGYSSSTGRAFMNVYGDFLFGDPEESTYVKYNAFTKQLDIKATVHFISPTTHQETTLDTFASAVTGGLESLQRQIDGEIDTWFYNGTPGPSVLPESEWVAIDTRAGNNNERLKHLGDLYYDNSTGYAYRYTNTGSEASPVFTWSQISDSAVIKALEDAAKAQDTADHKRRVFITSAGVLPTPPYSEGDIWMNVTYPANATATDAANNTYYNDILRCKVPATYNQQGELVREGVESGETALITHWQLSSKYTDDSKFNYFFTNTYSPFVTNIQQQVDKKAETWRQDDDPSLAQGWVPSEHVGDLWMDTNDNDQYGHKTFIYVDHGEGTNPRYGWEPQAVPDEVFDEIDGKAEIFVQKPTTYSERDMWIIESGLASTDMPSGCQAGDIVVADNMPSGTTKRENSYVKGDWRKKDRYTDDTKVDNLLNNTYVQQLIGGSINQAITDGDAAAVQQATQAAQTTYGYLTQALSQDTQITGGLILSSMIALRDGNGNMRSGISGTYIDRTTPNPEDPDEPYALGHGIAAWYGGENIDHEAFPALTNYAKSLFRFDGTGYLASGNISWDTDGALTIQGATLRAVEGSSTIEITTAQIASINWVNSNFISKAWFNKFFVAHYKRNGTNYTLAPNNDFPDDATDKTLESVFSFWTNYGLTALGRGVSGSQVVSVLDDLNDVDLGSTISNNDVLTYDSSTNKWTNKPAQGGSTVAALGDLTDVGISSLADKDILQYDYTNDEWKNVTLATALSGYATTSQLASYLPLSGGTLSGNLLVSVDKGASIGSSSARFYYSYLYRVMGLQSIESSTDGTYRLTLPSKTGTLAVVGDIPTNVSSLSNDAGYVTSSGVTSVATGTGLTGGTITSSGTISINSTYQTYISHGESAYNSLSNYVTLATDQTISGNKTFSGFIDVIAPVRSFGEGIRITNSSTGYGGVFISNSWPSSGSPSDGLCFCFATNSSSVAAGQKYHINVIENSTSHHIIIPVKNGTFALTSDIPTNNNQLTNGAGYITSSGSCAYATSAGSATDSTKLPLTGGTVTGQTTFSKTGAATNSALVVGGTKTNINTTVADQTSMLQLVAGSGGSSNSVAIGFHNPSISSAVLEWRDSSSYHYFNFRNDTSTNDIRINGNTIWHSANDGSGSGLDADLLDGQHASYFAAASSLNDYVAKSGSTMSGRLNINKTVSYDDPCIGLNYTSNYSVNDESIAQLKFGNTSMDNYLGVAPSDRTHFGKTAYFFHTGSSYEFEWASSSWTLCMALETSSKTLWVAGNIISAGGVTALSDARHKEVVQDTTISVEQVASMPCVLFRWKDKEHEHTKIYAGTLAQSWERFLPQVVDIENNAERTRNFNYGVAALVSAITTARKVVDHEKLLREQATKISELENKCSFLEREVERLKCA